MEPFEATLYPLRADIVLGRLTICELDRDARRVDGLSDIDQTARRSHNVEKPLVRICSMEALPSF